MIWPSMKMKFNAVVILAALNIYSLVGCGVKGDPLPPEKPAELGRGQPTYKKAAEQIEVKSRSKSPFEEDDEYSRP